LPPRSSTPIATCEASQCVDETTPKVPRISGRVVNDGDAGEGADALMVDGAASGWECLKYRIVK